MDKTEALELRRSTCEHLINKGELFLRVKVTTREQADELMEWMYASVKPMKAELLELAWNKATVSKEEYDLINHIKSVYSIIPKEQT